MADYYKRLSKYSRREQRLLSVMFALIVFCTLYYTVWIPVESNLATAQQTYRQQAALLEWIEANESRVQPLTTSATPIEDGTPLPVLLTKMATDNRFTVAQLQTGADDKVIMGLENVPFNNLINALDDLEHTHNVTLLEATINKTAAPGLVNATLHFGK